MAQDLCGIEMLFGIFNDAQDGATLPGQAKAARRQRSLQSSGGLSCWKWHIRYPDETVLQQDKATTWQDAITCEKRKM
jgi:hypothetical protein